MNQLMVISSNFRYHLSEGNFHTAFAYRIALATLTFILRISFSTRNKLIFWSVHFDKYLLVSTKSGEVISSKIVCELCTLYFPFVRSSKVAWHPSDTQIKPFPAPKFEFFMHLSEESWSMMNMFVIVKSVQGKYWSEKQTSLET